MGWAAAIPAIASIAGQLMASEGQSDANSSNQRIAQENSAFNAEQAVANRAFNAEQAQISRDWSSQEAGYQRTFQANMANSAWQRGIADMQAAGLNPMLAYSQGGAATPAGAMGQSSAASASPASAGAPGNQMNKYAAAGATATQWAQIANIQADTDKKREEAELTRRQHLGYTGEQEVRVDKMRKEAEYLVQQTNLSVEQRKKVMAEVVNVLAHTANLDADTALKKVNEVLQRNDVPRMEAEAAYFKTPVGKTSPHNKYGPQTPFRLFEGLGERIINKFSAKEKNYDPRDHEPAMYPGTHAGQYSSGRIER